VNYDIIGDIHGQYDKLTALLKTPGYHETLRAWRHPDRTAIFIGDLIDRGPKQVETLKLVRGKVDTAEQETATSTKPFWRKSQDGHFTTRSSGGSRLCRCGWTWAPSGWYRRAGTTSTWARCGRISPKG